MNIDIYFAYNCIIMILSISGAFLASSARHKHRFFGYCVWLISNGAIAVNFWIDNNLPMTLTFLTYEIFNIRGVWSNTSNEMKIKIKKRIRY